MFLIHRSVLLLAVLNVFCVSLVHAMDTPISLGELLVRLESAERQLSFEGRFTYEQGGTIDTYEILRLVVDGIEYEKTTKLNGPRREHIRFGRNTRCLTTSNHLMRGHPLNLKQGGAISLNQSYNFYFLGEDRVASKSASVIRIEPKDVFRYGRLLTIDNESGLVVRSVITSGKKNALERVQYVSLNMVESEVESYLSEQEINKLKVKSEAGRQKETSCNLSIDRTSPWRPSWVPAGFVLTDYTYTEQDGHMETYSDGLGVFSVFVGSIKESQAQRILAHRGATVAFLSNIQLRDELLSIAVVGEIPLTTAQKISATIISAANIGASAGD